MTHNFTNINTENINYLKMFSLEGKVVFVTGGGGLLGSVICKALSMVGGQIVILDINKQKGHNLAAVINNAGYQAYFEYFNAADLKNIDKNISKLVKKYKTINVWINSSYPHTKDWGNHIENISLFSWRKNVDMHLNSYAWMSKKAALTMKELKIQGSIINFASIYGIVGPDFSIYKDTEMTIPAAYSVIKGGIINFTKYLASYYGKFGIRVNCISPGGIFDQQFKIFIKRYCQKAPLKRMAIKEDVIGGVIYLASEASGYVTGHNLVIDGGWTCV